MRRGFLLPLFSISALYLALVPTGVSSASMPDVISTAVVDSLGSATTTTQFSVFGSSGSTIANNGPTTLGFRQDVGPRFTLRRPRLITEIGGFVSSGKPLSVYVVRASLNGVPDSSTILATYTLSHPTTPSIVSFESVQVRLPLRPGTYFALFMAQNGDEGELLANASFPFAYQAELVTIGVCSPPSACTVNAVGVPGAVRILAQPTAADST
jgi:hypothetical protein